MNPQRKIMKIYISQPVCGVGTPAIESKRERIKSLCRKAFTPDVEFIDQVNLPSIQFPPNTSINKKRITYIARSIGMMADADLIVFTDDPDAAIGTSVELLIAQKLDINHIYSGQLDEIIKFNKCREERKNENSNSG